MAMLILDCPRCGERRMTMDLKAASTYTEGLVHHEMYLQCRHCNKSAVWHAQPGINKHPPGALLSSKEVVNDHLVNVSVVRPVASSQPAPEHTPANLKKIFDEGAECYAIGCWNAAGSMFRKIVDEISKSLLPPSTEAVPDKHTRYNLKPRLKWLFDNGKLAKEVEGLADCIREDANDAVHNAPIGEPEATDLLDFTVQLLERLYTTPGRLKAAEGRRLARREAAKKV